MKFNQIIKTHYLKKPAILLEFLLFISLPIILRFQLSSFVYLRHILFVVGILYVFFISRAYKFNTLDKYGITKKNFIISCKKLIPSTIFWIAITILLGYLNINNLIISELTTSVATMPIWANFVLYTILSVPIQEIMFRGFLINRIKLTTNNQVFIILYSSLAFGLSHLMFANIYFTILTTLISISWTRNYYKYNNLLSIILFHSIMGSITLYINFFLVP